ncbi:MAG: TonB family protein [Bacteroidales bacterium]|nr:TonB family protein [Bacteroidales bacterium]
MNNKTNIKDFSNCFSQEFLLKYVNNELSNAENLVVEHHIKECEICSDIVDGFLLMENPKDIINIAASLNADIDLKIRKKRRIFGMNTTVFRAVAAVFLLLFISGSFLIINNIITNMSVDEIKEFSQLETENFKEQDDEIFITKENTKQVADANAQEKISGNDDNKYAEYEKTETVEEFFEEEENTKDIQTTKEAQVEKSVAVDGITDVETNAVYSSADPTGADPTGTASVKSEMLILEDDKCTKAGAIQGNGLDDLTSTSSVSADLARANRKDEREFNKGNRTLQKNKELSTTNKINNEEKNDVLQLRKESDEIIEPIIVVLNMEAESDSADEPIAFASVEQKPEFHNGDSALMTYIANNFEYPEGVKELNLSGKIYVKFTITELGKVSNVQVVKGIYPALDNEAIRVVKNMPDWIPAKQNGKPVAVNYVLPIKITHP